VSKNRLCLRWQRFDRFVAARNHFRNEPCAYIQVDRHGRPLRVGKASRGLEARYRGGTGYALDAAGYGSGNHWFVAPVAKELCALVEQHLIWSQRSVLLFNNQGLCHPPAQALALAHRGQPPRLAGHRAAGRRSSDPR
jgi:hypothetical protein